MKVTNTIDKVVQKRIHLKVRPRIVSHPHIQNIVDWEIYSYVVRTVKFKLANEICSRTN